MSSTENYEVDNYVQTSCHDNDSNNDYYDQDNYCIGVDFDRDSDDNHIEARTDGGNGDDGQANTS